MFQLFRTPKKYYTYACQTKKKKDQSDLNERFDKTSSGIVQSDTSKPVDDVEQLDNIMFS